MTDIVVSAMMGTDNVAVKRGIGAQHAKILAFANAAFHTDVRRMDSTHEAQLLERKRASNIALSYGAKSISICQTA